MSLFRPQSACQALRPLLFHLSDARHSHLATTAVERWVHHTLFEPRLLALVDAYLDLTTRVVCSNRPSASSSLCWHEPLGHFFTGTQSTLKMYNKFGICTRFWTMSSMAHVRCILMCQHGIDFLLFATESHLVHVYRLSNHCEDLQPVHRFRPHSLSFKIPGRLAGNGPWGMALDPVRRHLYVCDVTHVAVVSIDNWETVRTLGKPGALFNSSEPGALNDVGWVTLDLEGEEVYVTEFENHRVSVFGMLDGLFHRCFGSFGSDEGQFGFPRGIAWHPRTREIIVADSHNWRLAIFDRSGRFLRDIGRGRLQPNDVQVRPSTGHVFVDCILGGQVYCFAM